jgi:hypothetical protein
MKDFPNPEFPINSADCAEIEAIFIELIRQRDAGAPGQTVNAVLPFQDLSGNSLDLHS